MQALIVILNVIHVLGAVIWAGVAFYQFAFLVPAIQQAGPPGGQVMQRLLSGRLLQVMSIVPALVVGSGLVLYWFHSGGLSAGYFTTFRGIVLTVGALAGIAAFFEGMTIIGPTAARMRDLGADMAKAGGPPAPAQMEQMQALRARMSGAGARGAVFLLVAVVFMAIGA